MTATRPPAARPSDPGCLISGDLVGQITLTRRRCERRPSQEPPRRVERRPYPDRALVLVEEALRPLAAELEQPLQESLLRVKLGGWLEPGQLPPPPSPPPPH